MGFSNHLVCLVEVGGAVQPQEAMGRIEGPAWLSSYMERKEPDAVTKAEAEFSELTAGIYLVCKISRFATEIAGTQSPEPHTAQPTVHLLVTDWFKYLYLQVVAYGL